MQVRYQEYLSRQRRCNPRTLSVDVRQEVERKSKRQECFDQRSGIVDFAATSLVLEERGIGSKEAWWP
jgi:hypothetical protein